MDFLIPNPNGLAPCRFCSESFHWLGDHLLEVHSYSVEGYLREFPDAYTCSPELHHRAHQQIQTRKRVPASISDLTINFAGVSFPIDLMVPSEDCLPMPPHYQVPRVGRLAQDVQDAAIAVRRGRSIWAWGPPGTGKDAVFSALCAMTRRPSLLFTVVQGADIASWKFTRSFNSSGTAWEEGRLLKALRDGYTTRDGRRVPYLIVLSDFDRATRQQAEELRQILDSIQGRITGPTGEVWPTFPGTVIVATANTSGGGDASGRFISSNPIDASIMDRFERKIRFHSLAYVDELAILKAKFPIVASRYSEAIDSLLKATAKIREAVEKEEVYCEWSHRTVCAWVGAIEDLLVAMPTKKDDQKTLLPSVVRRAGRFVLDGLPDVDTRARVKLIIDPHLKEGILNPGSTEHIAGTDLAMSDW